MQYSCAYFLNDNESLEQAQQNKLRLIAAKLDLKPGLKILDIGCGWGGMALYLAAARGCRCDRRHAVEGAARARQREARRLGLADRVRFRAAGLPRGRRAVRPHRLGRHVRARRRAPLRRVLRQGERADDRRRRHAAALHRPHEPARHGESLAAEVYLPRRLFAGAVGGVHGGRAGQPVGDGSRIPAPALCQDAEPLVPALRGQPRQGRRRCTTSASAACGSSTWSAPR